MRQNRLLEREARRSRHGAAPERPWQEAAGPEEPTRYSDPRPIAEPAASRGMLPIGRLGRRGALAVRISAVSLVLAGVLAVGVEGILGRAALVLAGAAGLIAPLDLSRSGPPGPRGVAALGTLALAVVVMLVAVAGGG